MAQHPDRDDGWYCHWYRMGGEHSRTYLPDAVNIHAYESLQGYADGWKSKSIVLAERNLYEETE